MKSPKGKVIRPPRPEGRISPTKALKILMTYYKAPDAAVELTLATQRERCGLWCNGNFLSSTYIVEAGLKVVAERHKGRWKAKVVSSQAWEHPPKYYRWKFDENEVAALLPGGSPAQDEIKRFVARKWPGGEWNDLGTGVIIKAAEKDDEFKKTVNPFPNRDVFLRALGRRKG